MNKIRTSGECKRYQVNEGECFYIKNDGDIVKFYNWAHDDNIESNEWKCAKKLSGYLNVDVVLIESPYEILNFTDIIEFEQHKQHMKQKELSEYDKYKLAEIQLKLLAIKNRPMSGGEAAVKIVYMLIIAILVFLAIVTIGIVASENNHRHSGIKYEQHSKA